ncbi:hypothetical protein PtA15_11A132 [Puccinia triticina]|uniref:Uncharacterized protein n=1 Tax=Puccinia triticina TaxID=208348 RepID=A0ABY7CVV8_9BASI|nr:uncharacterized protein PtA15_11A132 [Puccinia triticina]WAQ89444.1 hypothetical protein PtA15_11A132 [Puccinia triticina]WAR59502.1 hypothetical protein PtB15_11B142 [Puccinia triticina]
MAYTSFRARARAGVSIKLPLWVRCIVNGLMLAVVIGPGAFVLWVSIRTALDMQAIEIASKEILTGLHEAAPSYRPETYTVMSLFEILKPGQVFAVHTVKPDFHHIGGARTGPSLKTLARDAKLMLLVYLVLQLVATALYLPTSILALRGLRKQTAPPSSARYSDDSEMLKYQTPTMKLMNDGPARERAELERVRQRLIKHSCLLYLDTILYCPLLCYMGTHVHTAIIGNIILALLIQNTLYTTRASAAHSNVAIERLSSYVKLERETKDTTHSEVTSLHSLTNQIKTAD